MMDAQMMERVPRMLQQISMLSHDPDAAELVRNGAHLAESFAPLMRAHSIAQATARQRDGGDDSSDETDEYVLGANQLFQLLAVRSAARRQSTQSTAGTGLSLQSVMSGQRPLDPLVLDRLPVSRLTAEDVWQLPHGDGSSACAVCQEDHTVGQQVLTLPCGHMFCAGCGRAWLHRSCTCPICRQEVRGEQKAADKNGRGGQSVDDRFRGSLVQGGLPSVAARPRTVLELGISEQEQLPPAVLAPSLPVHHPASVRTSEVRDTVDVPRPGHGAEGGGHVPIVGQHASVQFTSGLPLPGVSTSPSMYSSSSSQQSLQGRWSSRRQSPGALTSGQPLQTTLPPSPSNRTRGSSHTEFGLSKGRAETLPTIGRTS